MKTIMKFVRHIAAFAAVTWFAGNIHSTAEDGLEISQIGESLDGSDAAVSESSRREDLRVGEIDQVSPVARRDAHEEARVMSLLYDIEAWSEFPDDIGIPLPWVSIGPGNIGGRIRSIIVHPTSHNIMWVGSVSGGIWKSTDSGASWNTNTDLLGNLAISCMVMDPANPDILYAGTGEGFCSMDGVPGDGIFKTTNGGATWQQLPSTKTMSENDNFSYVNRLAISPNNPQLLLAATGSGSGSGKILRSTDGGITWLTQLTSAPMLDIRFRPPNSQNAPEAINNCVAANSVGSVFYSSDDGQTWNQATGLPAPPLGIGRIELAYARSAPSIVYASAEINGRLYKSTNGGASFALAGAGAPPSGSTGVNCYFNSLWVDPTNPDIVLVGSNNLWRTVLGGAAGIWTGISYGGDEGVHPDHHVLVEHPLYDGAGGNNNIVYDGSDGGITRIENVLDTPVTYTKLNINLSITQFYGGAGHVATGKIIGGTQDNGTLTFTNDPEDWRSKYAGDGGFCAVDQTENPFFYGEYVNLQIHRSTNGGDTAYEIWRGIPDATCGVPCAEFIAPFVLDPNNENRMLAGGLSLWRSNDVRNTVAKQPTWTEIKPRLTTLSFVTAIAVAQGSSNIVWVGHKNGAVYRTTNGTAASPTWIQANNGLPTRKCSRIAIQAGQTAAPEDPEQALPKYVTFNGFPGPGDSNVWKTTDNGQIWTDISGNVPHRLPRAPIFSIVVSPSNPDVLYVGTEVGVFASKNGGVTWSAGAPGVGQPANVRVDELFWMGNKLVAATHGRGMFTIGR